MTTRSMPFSDRKKDTERGQSPARSNHRGSIRAKVLASTGEDVSRCNNCDLCEKYLGKDMDLTIGEILQAANRNDETVLACQTLWNCDELLERKLHCQAGIDVASVLMALIHLAQDRGIHGPIK
jgi:heterodisulfide reductase subunit C